MGKYAESRKRRDSRRRIAKRYYALCFRNPISLNDYTWIEYPIVKSKEFLINILNRMLFIDDGTGIFLNTVTPLIINTWFFSGKRTVVSSEYFSGTQEKTVREHIEDYIFEQRCMVRSALPQDLVRMLYTFL